MAGNYSSDPVYQQWLGTLGFLEGNATRQADDARTRATNQYDFAAEGIGIDRERNVEAIGGNFENRGLTRSGEHLKRRAESLRDSNRAMGGLELNTADRFADIENGLMSELAQLQLRNSDQMYDAEGRLASRAGADYDYQQRRAFLEAG